MINFTIHALERMKARGISIREIQSISEDELVNDSIKNQQGTYTYKKKKGKATLNIIFRLDNDGIMIITCFRTRP